jgi:hypothetical protein
LSGRAVEFARRDVERVEQGGELAVEVGAYLGDRGEAEAGDLRAGLVGGEERAVIGFTRACGIRPASRCE